MILNKEIITIFKSDNELFEKYKTYIPSLLENDYYKITIVLENNVPSNESGPAIVVETSTEIIKSWILKGFYHRQYGPAIEYKFHKSNNKWIINGLLINTDELNKWMVENNINEDYSTWGTIEKTKFIKWKNS